MRVASRPDYIDEAEQLCDRLVVMESPRDLIERYSTREVGKIVACPALLCASS